MEDKQKYERMGRSAENTPEMKVVRIAFTLIQNLVQWADKFGRGLDDLPQEKRRDVLRLIVDQVLIDRDNNVSITLGIPTENFTSIEKEESPYPRRRTAQWGERTPQRSP